jgi:glycerophosphoryl diester phosphodiesterase
VQSAVESRAKVQVIAHRGASALRPEHTLAAYRQAIEDGADFIEPDLVMSRDGVLVARHECELGRSSDVAAHPEFAARRTRQRIDGEWIEGWFCEDFSLEELRRLRAREPMPELRGTQHDGLDAIPTFEEIVGLVAEESDRRGRRIGIIPELKNSTHHRSAGLNLERALIAATRRHDCLQRLPFGIQSFEVGNLIELSESIIARFDNIFLVQLVGDDQHAPFDLHGDVAAYGYGDMLAPSGLARIAGYADAIAVHRHRVLPLDPGGGGMSVATSLVEDAHANGLAVQAWTLRPENRYLPPAFRCGDDLAARCESGAIREAQAFIFAGVDALFFDDPALGRRAVDTWKS